MKHLSRKQEKQKRSFSEDLSMIVRAFRLNAQITKNGMVWKCIETLARQAAPYFSLYMSALIVDEIVSGAELKPLLFLALVTVSVQFLISMLSHLIGRKVLKAEEIHFYLNEFFLLKVLNRMQYQYFEKPDTALLRAKISNSNNYGGHGLRMVYFRIVDAVAGLFDLIVSTALTVTMFRTLKDVSLSGFLAFVNSPFSAAIIVFLIGINVTSGLFRQKKYVPMEMEGWEKSSRELSLINTYFANGDSDQDAFIFGANKLGLKKMKQLKVDGDNMDRIFAVRRRMEWNSIFFDTLMQAGLFLYVGAKAYIGVFGIGNFVLYTGTVEKFVNAVSRLVSTWGALKDNNKYLEDLFRFEDLPDEMYKGTLSVEKRDDNRFEIEFRNVSFKYPGSEEYALKNINFRFRIGERLAFVGMNGSGKTTFVKLLCRLYDPTEGKILLNGIDITRYNYDQYMQLFAVVFQDYAMFAFDVAGNVSAQLKPDREKITDCLQRVGLGDRIPDLERGIDTYVTKKYDASGEDFSGGERQKIAIARALYKDSPFIIMDEPTAALDPLAEADIYSRLDEIIENRTAIYISHRLSSCKFCDEIAVFHEGEIIQMGNHEELLADAHGKYRELWQAQAQYYV